MGAPGLLVLAAAPIGDADDTPARLIRLLASADVVAAEDTRRLRRLAATVGVPIAGRVVSYYDAVEAERTPGLVATMVGGGTVLLVTDAGMPTVSDPGYRLVAAAVAAGVPVTAIPGPSAVLTALAVSGLPADRFCFEGFLPRRAGERTTRLRELTAERRTLVFFEAPHRLAAALVAMAQEFGPDRPAAVCRELTKTHEEVRRGPLATLAAWAQEGVRGEVTVVVAGAPAAIAPTGDPQDWARAVAEQVAGGRDRRTAMAAVAAAAGVPRRRVYDAVVAAKRVQGEPRPPA